MTQSNHKLEAILEGAIIASSEPLSLKKLSSLFGEDDVPSAETINTALRSIKQNCQGRGFKLVEVASGWRFQVREEFATWVNRLWEEKPQKYSRALLETLALIAYRQPITRGDIEDVRGVAVSSHIIKTLMEREWVKVIGHRDVPGRPALYATTPLFLDYFNLQSLDELPTLGDLKDIDALDGDLDLGEPLNTADLGDAASDDPQALQLQADTVAAAHMDQPEAGVGEFGRAADAADSRVDEFEPSPVDQAPQQAVAADTPDADSSEDSKTVYNSAHEVEDADCDSREHEESALEERGD